MKDNIETIGEVLYWAYANLAMAHAAINENANKYEKKHFFIRTRLYNGLKDETMNIKSFFDDERLKMILPQSCCYCASTKNLAADHIIPRKEGGLDIGENLIWACRSCNSSKSAIDMLEWMQSKNKFPSILLYRRYLKILIKYCREKDLINVKHQDYKGNKLPFNLSTIPKEILPLDSMMLWITEITGEEKSKKKEIKYRIANWNLERPLKQSKKLTLALQKIKEISPDICVLTETSDLADLGEDYLSIKTEKYDELPNDQWAAIWSKWPIINEIETFDSKRSVCALIDAPFGEIIIYATIIPYHNAGVRKGEKYGLTNKIYTPWQMHKENIASQSIDWLSIINAHPKTPFCIAGDFNQTRENKKGGYGSEDVRNLLTDALQKCNLLCLTEEDFENNGKLSPDPKKGKTRRNVDHICISQDWSESMNSIKIGAWDHFTSEGKYMSDHNGVYIDIIK